jgi:hypothetical protein
VSGELGPYGQRACLSLRLILRGAGSGHHAFGFDLRVFSLGVLPRYTAADGGGQRADSQPTEGSHFS